MSRRRSGHIIVPVTASRRADMFTADGKPSDDDPREHGPTLDDERTTLSEALRSARLTLELKCADLDAEAMARADRRPYRSVARGARHASPGSCSPAVVLALT